MIWTQWFGQPIDTVPVDGPIWHHGSKDRFANHDLLFEFKDGGGQKHTIRCSAHHFLSSPWSADGQTFACIKSSDQEEFDDTTYTLGMVRLPY